MSASTTVSDQATEQDPATGAQEPAGGSHDESSEAVEDTAGAARARRPNPQVVAGAALALGLAAAAVVAASRRASAGVPAVGEGESILLTSRPRKVLWRYALSLGLWEPARRATRYTVTNRRVMIEDGLLSQGARSLPLSRINHVRVRTGPWQGYVEFAASGGSRNEAIGPLRTPRAREFAHAIMEAMSR